MSSTDRSQLRRDMRARRNAVPHMARREAANAIARHLLRSRILDPTARIAVYIAFDGEIDVTPVIRIARRRGCALFAPHIVNMAARKMEFVALTAPHGAGNTQRLASQVLVQPRSHRYTRIDPRLLNVVLVPLVAFDAHGWRLGFGAGFYDRKFAFKRRIVKTKPLLIGVGYEFQRVPRQLPSPWDVGLDGIVTERGFYRCRRA